MPPVSSYSFRLTTCRVPFSLHCKTYFGEKVWLKVPAVNLAFFKPITFERVPRTKNPSTRSSPSSIAASLRPTEDLPPKLQEMVQIFQSVQEPKAKYEQLIFYGQKLKPLDAHFKTKENKVEGCVSQVWVRAFLDQDKNVVFEADSDSVLTRGLAALLVQGLSGRPIQEVLRVTPDFVVRLGLQQSLSPSRNNGFLNMLKLMQRKALMLYVKAEKGDQSVQESNSEREFSKQESDVLTQNSELKSDAAVPGPNNGFLSEGESKHAKSGDSETVISKPYFDSLGNRGKRIKDKLERELNPVTLEIEDVSSQHAGHAGARGSDGETHFNLKVVSKEFEGKSLIKRHRLIYSLLQEELDTGLHALSIVAKTPSES